MSDPRIILPGMYFYNNDSSNSKDNSVPNVFAGCNRTSDMVNGLISVTVNVNRINSEIQTLSNMQSMNNCNPYQVNTR